MKPLPPSNNKKFWKDGDHYVSKDTFKECDHRFKRDRHMILCDKCHMGVYDPEYKIFVKHGKLSA